jgi:hypothetical protein
MQGFISPIFYFVGACWRMHPWFFLSIKVISKTFITCVCNSEHTFSMTFLPYVVLLSRLIPCSLIVDKSKFTSVEFKLVLLFVAKYSLLSLFWLVRCILFYLSSLISSPTRLRYIVHSFCPGLTFSRHSSKADFAKSSVMGRKFFI